MPACARRLLAPFLRKRRDGPEGLYLFGRVGRGKTMLMDLFFASVAMRGKRRVHFQEFMSEAHELIDRARRSDAADPVKQAADPHRRRRAASSASTSSK